MRAVLVLTGLLALPLADEPPQLPEIPDVTLIATSQLKALLADNLKLRPLVLDATKERDAAIDSETACVAGRST